MTDDKEIPERFNWKKLFRGLFVASNYGKALVFGLCLTIMLSLGYCVVLVVKSRFVKPIPSQTVGTNQGTVNTTNTTTDKKGWQLFGGLVQINN